MVLNDSGVEHSSVSAMTSAVSPLNPAALPARLAFILPRYAKSIGGGAETLARELAQALVAAVPSLEIEVWTTCALDHRTWANEAAAGIDFDGPIKVIRFPVDERDLEVFISSEHAIQKGDPFTAEQQLAWLAASVNSKELYEHIVRCGDSFDVLLFAPYLFATSFWGSLIYPEKSVLIPCLHDEAYAYLDIFRAQFGLVRGLVCNAVPEQKLLLDICQDVLTAERTAVVGMGFHPSPCYQRANARSISLGSTVLEQPYLLYSGRKESGKNVDWLIDCFEHAGDLKCSLVLVGAGSIDFRQELPQKVIDLGFVSEEEKLRLMANALALCQPSQNESFSIVMMEAWQQGTPCLVHADGAVTRDHVIRSGGGLYFQNAHELRGVVEFLLQNPESARALGAAGQKYVATEYSWDAVLGRFVAALQQFGLANTTASEVSSGAY